MAIEFEFPVLSLLGNITQDMMKYASANIRDAISKDLDPVIEVIEKNSKCTDVGGIKAYCTPNNERRYKVYISAAFAQLLWIISDVTIKAHDYHINMREFEKFGVAKEDIIKINEEAALLSDEKIIEQLKGIKKDFNLSSFRSYIYRINELINTGFSIEKINDEQRIGLSLLEQSPFELEFEQFGSLDMKSGYGQTSNACTVKGVSFILLHEFAHYSLEHMDKRVEASDEIDADQYAFWTIDSDTNSEENFTAMIGVIAMMFAILLKDYTTPSDGVHPREDKRLFDILKIIESQNPKYAEMAVWLFKIWIDYLNLPDFPDIDILNHTEINKIKEYFQREI